MEGKEVIWSVTALGQLEEIYTYLSDEAGFIVAENVKNKVVESTKKLIKNPLRYPKDQLKSYNLGEVRVYTLFSYRISYEVSDNLIIILRIRHTSREPLEF